MFPNVVYQAAHGQLSLLSGLGNLSIKARNIGVAPQHRKELLIQRSSALRSCDDYLLFQTKQFGASVHIEPRIKREPGMR